MAFECNPPHAGDMGDLEPEYELDADCIYEQKIERQYADGMDK